VRCCLSVCCVSLSLRGAAVFSSYFLEDSMREFRAMKATNPARLRSRYACACCVCMDQCALRASTALLHSPCAGFESSLHRTWALSKSVLTLVGLTGNFLSYLASIRLILEYAGVPCCCLPCEVLVSQQLLCVALQYDWWKLTAENELYPNPTPLFDDDLDSYFEFSGMVMGKLLMEGALVRACARTFLRVTPLARPSTS
jgi:hypothetical protein